MTTRILTASVLSVAVTAIAAARITGSAQPAGWPLAIAPLASPAAAGSAQPQLSVSGGGALLSWIEQADGRAALKFAMRTPDGWSAARTVASGDNWFVNWADVPSVVRLADGTLAAHWLQKRGP